MNQSGSVKSRTYGGSGGGGCMSQSGNGGTGGYGGSGYPCNYCSWWNCCNRYFSCYGGGVYGGDDRPYYHSRTVEALENINRTLGDLTRLIENPTAVVKNSAEVESDPETARFLVKAYRGMLETRGRECDILLQANARLSAEIERLKGLEIERLMAGGNGCKN